MQHRAFLARVPARPLGASKEPCRETAEARRLLRDESGAVIVEHLITFVPVLFFALVTLQIIDLCRADIVMRTAAVVAARAAAVILPADPADFDGAGVDQFSGAKRRAVTDAARAILRANSHFDLGSVQVAVTGASGTGPVHATVSADYRCLAKFVNVVCGGSSRRLRGSAAEAYQGAPYPYE